MAYTLDSAVMDRRITIQQRNTSVDTWGQQVTTWADYISCWAAVMPLSGRELLAAQAQQAETTHTVLIRYRAGITPAMRLLYQGRVMNILAAIDPETAHVALQLLCSEGLNQG